MSSDTSDRFGDPPSDQGTVGRTEGPTDFGSTKASAGEVLLRADHVSKTFPGVRALDDIHLDILPGEIHALVGENGAGKSSLIKILSGVYQADEGARIELMGRVVDEVTPLEAVRSGISVIYQDFSLFPNLTVAENIAISSELGRGVKVVNWQSMRDLAGRTLDRLGVQLPLESQLGDLSVARQQIVAIARALTSDARLLIMDEPTSALSRSEVELLFTIMRSLKASGMSILFVSHKLDELFAIADRFTVLRDGKYMGTYSRDELDNEKLISLMVGRKIEYTVYPKRKRTGPILEVKNLSKSGNFIDVSFVLNRGEILGVTGLVGAGRTEMVQAIYGMNPPDSGSIMLDGAERRISSPQEAVDLGIGYVPENRLEEGLVLRQSTGNNVALVALSRLTNAVGAVLRGKRRELVDDSIKKLAIRPADPDLSVSKLSGGNQQRVVLAKWLAQNPKVLIVDEPTNGIDVGAKSEIHRLLRDLADQGMGIILVSSELPEILAIADRILVMRRGRINGEFDGAEATQEQIMSRAILTSKPAAES